MIILSLLSRKRKHTAFGCFYSVTASITLLKKETFHVLLVMEMKISYPQKKKKTFGQELEFLLGSSVFLRSLGTKHTKGGTKKKKLKKYPQMEKPCGYLKKNSFILFKKMFLAHAKKKEEEEEELNGNEREKFTTNVYMSSTKPKSQVTVSFPFYDFHFFCGFLLILV